MRCPILVGREGPVSLIAGAVRRLRHDSGAGALVVVGEAGVGKTRLAEYLDDTATRAGIRVVHGRALPDGLGGPLRPIAEMLLELTRDSAAPEDTGLAPYVPVLASLVPHWRFMAGPLRLSRSSLWPKPYSGCCGGPQTGRA